ncbi:unnamed protein product [Malus baccata var. baccata]
MQRMLVCSLMVGIDLVPITPVRGAFSIQQDITKPECMARLKKLIKKNGCSAFDLVLHDGSPNDEPFTPIKQDTNKEAYLCFSTVGSITKLTSFTILAFLLQGVVAM